MNWVFYALIAWICTGTSFILLKNVNSKVQKSVDLQFIYILITFIVSGLFSTLLLVYLVLTKNKDLKEIVNFSKTNIISLGIILVVSYIFLMIAGIKGGTPAFQIINLNIIIMAIGGYFLFKERLNLTKIIGICVAIIGAAIIIGG